MDELLKALKQKQTELRLSQNGMAELLEITGSQLSLIMSGNRSIGRDLLSAVTVKFPDLHPLVLKALAEIHNERNGVKA